MLNDTLLSGLLEAQNDMKPDKLVLNLGGNDELRTYLATKAPGDSCEFEVTAAIDEVAGDQAVFSVTDATVMSEPEEPEVGGDAEGKAGPADLPEFPV